jgi:DNA invertase Pin-like site-specific DNA recombinase
VYSDGVTDTLRSAVDVAADAIHPTANVAAIYVRQSRKKADGSEASPAVQREECQGRAAKLGLRTLTPYEDVGISGYDPDAERPDFDRMLRDAAAGKFSKLLVYYMSRFSRQKPLEVLQVVRELWSYGITIISVTEGEFVPDDFGSLIHLIARLEGNHKESALKSENVKKTKLKARNLGGYLGGQAPYGFTKSKVLRNGVAIQVLEPDPEEAPKIRALVDHLLKNRNAAPDKNGRHPASLLSAAEWLNEHGATPRRGKSWDDSSVIRMLIDPRLAGFAAEYVYERSPYHEKDQRKSRAYLIQRDDEGHPVIGNEAIITPADWYALQDHLKSRHQKGKASPGTSLFGGAGLLVCECGKKLTYFGAKAVVPNYRCPRTRTDNVGRTHEGGNSIAVHHVDDWVARRVMALITTSDGDDATLEILAEATRRYGLRTEAPQTAGERAELTRARAVDTTALEELYDREEAGDYDDPVGRKRFRQRKDAILGRINAATARLAELDEADSPALPIQEWVGEPDEDPIGPGSWWHGASLDDRRDFLRLFVERVEVRKAASKGGNYNGATYDVGSRAALTWVSALREDDEEAAL